MITCYPYSVPLSDNADGDDPEGEMQSSVDRTGRYRGNCFNRLYMKTLNKTKGNVMTTV